MAQTAMQQMLDELMCFQYEIPIDLIVKCNGLIEVEKEQMINSMIYTFNENNTLPYGMEYISKREKMLEDSLKYYNETYTINKV
jgi:hypothetical protein